MPGLNPGGMNGQDYGRYGPEKGFTNGHFDPYPRDDLYRDDMRGEEDIYRRAVRNGRPVSDRFSNDQLDQSSLSDFNSSEPAFELDHLATFAAGGIRKGTMHVEDGLRKLRQMENTTGIWTMRCILLVERRFVVILDKNSGEELERFPVQHIQEPTAIFKNDRREIYNNLIVFIVMDESNRKDAQADMHIFQSVRAPAQNIVDEIFAAKRGHSRVTSGGYKIPPPPSGPAPEPPGSRDPYDFRKIHETVEREQFSTAQYGGSSFYNGGGFIGGAQRTNMMARPSYSPYREREDEIGSNELLERDVAVEDSIASDSAEDRNADMNPNISQKLDEQLLNHCFDDIEKFVARLQQAAEAYKEMERRKRERGGKKNISGEGMLRARAQPPHGQDFVDIFKKFKLSFNLLAKLKAHIHDPNAPELVHFLFTPLSLIYEASRDPFHGNVNLGEQAVAPVLSQDAKQLLLNCLTSKEIELWQALGKNWTISKDEWKGYIPPYVPRFYDGWQPAPTLVDEPALRPALEPVVMTHSRPQDFDRNYVPDKVVPFPDEDRFTRNHVQDFDRFEMNHRASTPPRNPAAMGYQQYTEPHIDRNYRAAERRAPEPVVQQPPPAVSQPVQSRPPDDNAAYREELTRMNAKIYEAMHDRQGKNAKELTVHKGDILQVLDSSRNWWKVRNYKGESGYCPYTILKEVSSADNGRDFGSSMNASAEQIDPTLYERQATRPDFISEQFLEPPGENLTASSQLKEQARNSSRFEEVHIPHLSLEEEEGERHAFRPVEPAPYTNKGIPGIRKTQPQVDLHNELKSKLVTGALHLGRESGERVVGQDIAYPLTSTTAVSPVGSSPDSKTFYISQESSQTDVAAWLEMKGFSYQCKQALQGFTGGDLFSLHRNELMQLIGREEAARLEGQLTLQKRMVGYKTQSAAELNAIFSKRRARTDQQAMNMGETPDFSPLTPSSLGVADSDSDSDDRQLADTGKTLRELLIRQRQKIAGTSIFDQH